MQNLLKSIYRLIQDIDNEETLVIIYCFILGLISEE